MTSDQLRSLWLSLAMTALLLCGLLGLALVRGCGGAW